MVVAKSKIIMDPPCKKPSFDEILDKLCVIHSMEENDLAGHTTWQC